MFPQRVRLTLASAVGLFLWCHLIAAFAAAPTAAVNVALYQGADREKLLVDGAKREGQFTLYTSHTWFKTFVGEFEKKYPFVRASQWRNDSKNIIRKVLEEATGRALADGAPVKWRPLERVVTTVGWAGLLAKAANPHTALLFIDFLLSKDGQQLIMKGGLWSPREDVGSLDQKFKKNYLDEKYSSEQMETKIGRWETLLRQLFLRKRQ